MRHTEEKKAKLSAMRRGSNNPFYGKKHTPEVLEGMRNRARALNANRTYAVQPQRLITPTSDAIRGYLAGMIDADGSIRFRKKTLPFVCVYNTYAPLLDWLRETLGCGSIYKTTKGREQVQCWQTTAARDLFALLTSIRPFLIVKASDADAVLAFLREKYEWARTHQ